MSCFFAKNSFMSRSEFFRLYKPMSEVLTLTSMYLISNHDLVLACINHTKVN